MEDSTEINEKRRFKKDGLKCCLKKAKSCNSLGYAFQTLGPGYEKNCSLETPHCLGLMYVIDCNWWQSIAVSDMPFPI
jgi:hypothetical protein